MPVALILACAVLGGAVGALLPTPAYRLSVQYGQPPRSICATCSTALPHGYRGWLRVAHRCLGCDTRLGPAGWLTALCGALACAAVAFVVGPQPTVLAAFLTVAIAGVLLAAIDVACLRLPDPLVGGAGATALLLLAGAALTTTGPAPLVRGLLGAAALGGGYLLLALLFGAHLGFGDVKLAAVLGLLLGWVGWNALVLGAVLPHFINGPIALGLLLSRRAKRRSELPLGPALLAGALAALVAATGGHDA